jgi:hypothetical protein
VKIISTSLYGDKPKYVAGAVANCRLAPIIYPGWQLRIYVEEGHPAIPELIAEGAETISMPKSEGTTGMFWRFLAASDPDAERIIFRDLDSRLNVREQAAVNAWIASGKAAHIMRDHVHHTMWQMFGGMWGIKGGVIKDMAALIEKHPNKVERMQDAYFLIGNVYPLIENDCLEHGYAFNAVPFPPHTAYNGFVGQIFEADGTQNW